MNNKKLEEAYKFVNNYEKSISNNEDVDLTEFDKIATKILKASKRVIDTNCIFYKSRIYDSEDRFYKSRLKKSKKSFNGYDYVNISVA